MICQAHPVASRHIKRGRLPLGAYRFVANSIPAVFIDAPISRGPGTRPECPVGG